MAISVRFNDEFISEISIEADAEHRSIPKQIEYFVEIGKIAKDNPDLTYGQIKSILLSKAEIRQGKTQKYVRRTKRNNSNS